MEKLKEELIIKIIIKIIFIIFKPKLFRSSFDYQPKLNAIEAIQTIKKN